MKPILCLLAALVLVGCAAKQADTVAAEGAMTTDGLLATTKVLASDEFEGRAPGSPGEELTVAYLQKQFKDLGLAPGNPDGTYVQKVPLAGITSVPTAAARVGGKAISFTQGKDFIGVSRRFVENTEVKNSDLVFVGYGVVAPEYGWDDYKGVDVRGKTLVMLINDPPAPGLFKDRAMTYYGRWTYKYEIASEKGAAAAIIIHETGPAGYPFEVVTGSWGRENFDLQTADNNMSRTGVESWMSLDKAKELLKASGEDFDALKTAAATKEFKPIALKGTANFTVKNTLRKIDSRNVVAKLAGSEKPDEYVIYSAHWDHLGRDTAAKGDQIFNGAIDNASGTAALLELAKAYTKLDPKPKRSVLFLSVTAEEKGLLGAKYYATNPLYPLNKTLANINMDGVNQWGKTKDYVVVGLGNTTLDDTLAEAAKAHGRVLIGDAEPEKGFYYRSDHFEFAKLGVPALYTDAGLDYIGKPPGYGQQTRDQYTNNDYHKVSDEIKPNWDLTGAIEDLKLLFEVGYNVAQADKWPEWKPGTEFKALREKGAREVISELNASLIQIGVVRSAITNRKDLPPLGAPASVELFPEFAGGLLHIEKHSHLWVMAWLDTAAREPLQVIPRGLKDQGEAGPHGVFAVRSPARPNPIGLTAARVVGRSGLRIDFDALDFNDGTPVIDLKPYFASRDMIFSAHSDQVGRPADASAIRESAHMQALAFAGQESDGLDLAVEIVTHFRTEVLGYTDPEAWDMTVPIDRPRLSEALTGLTRTWPQFHAVDAVIFRYGAFTYEYELHEDEFRFYPH